MLTFFPFCHCKPPHAVGSPGPRSGGLLHGRQGIPGDRGEHRASGRKVERRHPPFGRIHRQELATIAQELIHIRQAGQLLGRRFLLARRQLILDEGKALLQQHQALGEGMNGLGQIFRVPGNAKRN